MDSPTQDAPPRRFPRPRFSLRTLLAATTLLCLFLGWYIPRVQNERRAANAILAAHGEAIYDWQIRPEDAPPDYQPDPPGPNLLRTWFGPHWFDSIVAIRFRSYSNSDSLHRLSYIAPHLVRLNSLRDLSLWGGPLSASDYQLLGRLAQLESLRINTEKELTSADAAAIARLCNLRELHLKYAKVTPASLLELARLGQLESLSIDCDSYHPNTLKTIEEYQLRDAEAKVLAEFPNLHKLSLYKTRITDEGLADLCRLSQLEYLSLSSPDVTSALFQHVARLQHLNCLGTWEWRIDNADFEQLASLPNLTILSLVTRHVTDESVPYVVQLPHLKRLQFTGDQITDASLPHLQQIADLEWLDLHHTSVNKLGQAVKDLRAALPNCKMLLPRTPQEGARHQAFIAYKWGGHQTVTVKPKKSKPNSADK